MNILRLPSKRLFSYKFCIFSIFFFFVNLASCEGVDTCSSCSSGTFFDSLSASCVSCRPGYKCLGGCNDPTPCGIGEYQPAYGSLACKTCLEGYYAAQEGSLLCTMCPPGYSCGNSSASNLIICNPGSFSTGGQAECTNCYEGTFSSNPGSSGCSDCPAGSYCSEGATKPVLCPAGSFAPAKSTECTTCPPGFYCPNEGSFTAYSCSIGTFSIGNQTQCTICPSGYSCPSTTHAIKQRCIQGTYSLSGQGNCTNCPSGKQCSVDGTSVKSCSPGSYSVLGDGTCHECLAGFYCPDTSMALQIPCNLGSYSSPSQSECTTCPPGHYCPSVACTGISDCSLPCNDGSYSLGGQTSCTLCSAGYACELTTSGVMTPCVSGEYSLPGQSSCNLCPPGYFCPSRSNEPMQCPAGTHSSYGQTSCTLALPGYFISLPGSVNSVICDAGYFSSGGAVICTPCNPGYLCPPGSTEASPPSSACPIGGYCAVATTFTPCPVGYYGIMEGGVSAEQACSPCDAGYYCNTVGGTVFDRQLCPSGAYCPVQSAVPISCSPGFLSAVTGQTSINTCVACPRGFYCLFPGTTQGTACPVGFYCPEGTSDYSVYPCPAGTFNDNNGLYLASQCSACPGGHYCLSGSSSPKACAPGTYNLYSGASSNSSCLPCEAGYACPAAGMSALTISCAPGYFCPQGTVYPERYPCPAGRYSDSVSLISQSACTLCPAGFTCGLHTTSETMTKCRKGFYCPEGTQYGRDLPCPAGSFSSQSQLSSQQECSACNPGNYCSGGNTTISGSCAAGYFCPTGTPSSTYFPCPAGTFSNSLGLYSVTECQRCSPGYFCPRGSTLMLPCPNGTYSSSDGTSSAQNCSICPAGYQCLTGSAHPKPCGLGRYSDEMASSCDICPLGKYCASNTSTAVQLVSGGGFWGNSNDLVGICFNGTYCPLGMKTVPNLLSHPCPAGYICPPGTEYPVPCPAGTYSKVSGRFEISDCLPSPVGHYSINGSHEPTGLCSPGYYCPLGSTSPNQVPCPTRTYLPGYGGESVEQCSLCTAGGYCPNEGNAIPIVCPKGFYCITGLDEPLPCLPGTYGNASGLTSASECNPCDGGMYCDGYALTSPRGYSYEGFYCISGCNTSTPMYDYGNLIGGLCTEGHYCAKGTVLPTPCPPGTFNPVNGSKVLGDCVPCTSGMYCEGYGNAAPTGPCKRGYYCSGGAYTPTQHEVLPGYYSLAGATNMTACSPGFYNNKYLQHNCTKCVEGYFCPNSGMSTYVEYLCIAGHYCPEGTAIPVRCPAGTFSPLTIYGNYDVKNCTACSSGFYCATAGLVEVTGPCDAGYYCTQKASSKTQPSYTDTGGPCTKGHYCLTGSDNPTPCPRGTYMADKQNDGNRTVRGINYHCDLCLSGKSCNSLGLLSYDGGIAEGYWAVEGAPSVIPVCHDLRVCGRMYGICPIGNHCPVNSSIPTPCGDGFYQDEIGQASCKVCPTGFFCTPSAKFNCPPGSYCPQGTHNQFLCPNGTYGASEGLQNITQCTPCTGGYYCATAGLSSPTGLCDKGYFCGGSSTVATPFGEGSIGGYAITYNGETCVHADNYTVNDICPPGHYCPRGSAAPIMCPPGTNATAVGQFSISGCGLCPAGFYCPNSGTVYATLRCPSGHFCQAGTSSLSQSTICPVGTYCPTGSVQYNSCPGGSYQNSAGMGSCIPCPAGYECPAGSTSYQIECPVNRYCPQGTEIGIYCKNGTYGNSTRQISQSDCTTCPGGKYCNQGFILGNCSSGYFCKSGQFSPAPHVDVSQYPDSNVLLHYLQSINGGPCYPGYYCPKATKNPRSCLNGTVRISPYGESQEDCGACPLGYLCSIGNPVPEKCQVGHYCPLKSAQFPCPKGTYNPLSSQFSLDNCTSCPAGFYCNSTGLSSYHNFPCPSGHFCVTKATSAFPCAGGTYRDAIGGIGQADCKTCPGGHFCSNGSSYYKVCNSGTYCPTGSASPTICPPGQYCPANAFVPILCPETYYCPLGASRPMPCSLGTYCPAGTVYPIPCPLGYKAVDNTNHTHHVLASLQSACVKCPAGYYGTDPNRLNCSLGTAGYYFIGASTSDKPTNFTAERGSICPKGTYCPAGSVAPTHCPPGSYQPKMGATSALSCILCQANYYQGGNGSESCFKCSSSSFSTAGSIACSCIGLNRVFQPADGFCICKPGFEFVNSNLEVSSTNDGAFDCQPIVYSRCIAPMVRRQDGSCGSNSDCNSVCKSEGGILDSNTGICLCSNITTLNQACDSNCRNSAPNVTCNSYGQLNVYDPATESSTILSPSQLADLGAGSITCSSGASVYSMKSSASGFAGVFGLGTSLSSLTNRRRLLSSSRDNVNISYNAIAKWNNFIPGINSNPFRESNETNILSFGNPLHRYLANDSSSAPELSNPIVVISAQDSIIFDIGGGYYPQYVKDSLLNTNPNFDYSAFRNLDSSSATVSTFSFTFTEPGNYVFQLSKSASSVLIISVLPQYVTRSTSAQFVEMSNGNLVTVGVKTTTSIVLQPDWNLVIGLLLGMLALVLIVIGGLYYFRKKSWSYHTNIESKYRRKNKAMNENVQHKSSANTSKPVVNNKVHIGDDSVADPSLAVQDLESAAFPNDGNELLEFDDEMLLPDLAKHMQTHHDEIDRQLVTQNDLLASLKDVLKKEVEELKSLLASTASNMSIVANGNGDKSQSLELILQQLKSDVLTRALFDDDMTLTEKRMIAFLDRTLRELRPEVDKIASTIVHEMAEQAIDLSDRDEAIVAVRSPSLREIIDDMTELKAFVDSSLLDGIVTERKRKQAAEDAFDSAIRMSSQLIFPLSVSEKLKPSKDAEIDLDIIHDDIISSIKIFSEKVPQFCTTMEEVESSLSMGLARTVNTGNVSVIEREQEIASQALCTYFGELLNAVNILIASIGEQQSKLVSATEQCRDVRIELVAAIDAILNPAKVAMVGESHAAMDRTDSNTQQILDSILAALKEQRYVDKGESPQKRGKRGKRRSTEPNIVDDENSLDGSDREDAASETSDGLPAGELSDEHNDETDEMGRSKSGDLTLSASSKSMVDNIGESVPQNNRKSEDPKKQHTSKKSDPSKSVADKDESNEDFETFGATSTDNDAQETDERTAGENSAQNLMLLRPKVEPIAVNAAGELLITRSVTQNKGKIMESSKTDSSNEKEKSVTERQQDSSDPSSSANAAAALAAAQNALKEIKDQAKEELQDIRDQFSSDSKKLKEEFELEAKKEKSILEKQLKSRHQKRLNDLTEQDSKSSEEAAALLKKEDERLRKELDDKLQQQLEQVLAKKAAEAEEIEKQIMEHERIESAKANAVKEAALRRMAQVKKDHLDEIHHLEESLLQKHTEHELKLKKTLMEKKLHSLNEHEKQRLEMEAKFAEEELQNSTMVETPLKSSLKRQGTAEGSKRISFPDDGLDSRLSTPRLFAGDVPDSNNFDQKVIENVLNNETLTNLQKEDLLDAAQADMKMMDSILDLERKRQELIMKQAFETNPTESSALEEQSTVNTNAAEEEQQRKKFEEEKQQLQKSLEEERNKKLDELMQNADPEETELDADGAGNEDNTTASIADSLGLSTKVPASAFTAEEEASKPTNEKKLKALSESRIAALYRYWAFSAKISYKELVLRFNVNRTKVQISKYDTGGSVKADSAGNINSLHVQDCEDQLNGLDIEQEMELISLQSSLQSSLEETLKAENERRDTWLAQKDSGNIDLPTETAAFIKEYKKKFMSLSGKMKKLSDLMKETNKLNRELKLAMFQSRSFTLDTKDFKSILDVSKSELEESNLLVEKMQEEDLRVLFAEEALLLQMLEHPTKRLEKSDEITAQSHLHLRVLGVMNAHSTILPRLSMLENELLYETKAIRLSNSMLRQKASKEKIEEALVALFEEKKNGSVEILTKLQESFMNTKTVEKKRQECLKKASFELERARAIEEHARRDAQTALDMSKSQRKIQVALLFALEEKKTILVENARNAAVSSDEIRQLALQQVDAELIRDELEMKVAFDSFEVGFTLVERYSSEVLLGVQPSTAYIKQLVKVSHSSELHFTQQAIKLDECRKRFKKLLAAALYTDFERKRLQSLERISGEQHSEDLDKILLEIKQQTAEEIHLIDVATSAELWRVDNMFAQQLDQNVKIHDDFAVEIEDLARSHEKEKEVLLASFERHKEYTIGTTSGQQASEERDRALDELEQRFVNDIARVDVKFEDSLYSSFKKVMSRILSQVQVEMELANLRNRIRQESEAVESVVAAGKQTELQTLIVKQAERRAELKQSQIDLKKQLEEEAKMAEEKYKQEKREIEATKQERQISLAEELISSGVEDSEALAKAAAEVSKLDKEKILAAKQNLKQIVSEKVALLSRAEGELKQKLSEIELREDDESKELRSEQRNNDRELSSGSDGVSEIVKAASIASKEVQDKTREELADIKEKLARDSDKLKEEFAIKAEKERSVLENRLKGRHQKRISELMDQHHKSAPEAEAILNRENEKYRKELNDQLQLQLDQVLSKKAREAADIERQVLESEHKAATSEAARANSDREAALRRMAQVKKDHMDDMRHLEEDLIAKRKEHEDHLKKLLKERKARALKELTDEKQRLEMEAQLAHEELESLNKLQLERSVEEAALKEKQRVEMEKKAAAAIEELQKAELAAAKAAAKESTIRGLKDTQKQSEEELNMKEVQRLRNVHKMEEDKETEASQLRHNMQSNKLHDKLQRKRQRKEQELRTQEQREIQELVEKQQREKDENEALRAAKLSWNEKIQEVLKVAEEMGLSQIEKEDYCFRETLGKNLVPATQLNEAVQMVQRKRHDQEMAKLLKKNFEERVAKLTAAVEEVIENKSKSRISLIEGLMKAGTYDQLIESETAKLDAEYHKKQIAAEHNVTAALEDQHLKSQMELRQQQLVEIAHIVALYTDKDTLEKLNISSGKTQEEELLEYKNRIEAEKKQREEALAKEREDMEAKLREKMQDEVNKMQVQLQEEQSKAEAEFNRKRNMVLKQREEFEKKKAEEMEQLDNLEKARILSNFEKEHAAAQDVLDQDRKNKKAKLADRLQKRKSTIHQSLPTEDSKHLATIAERVPTGSEPTSVKVSKDKDAHASHSHSHSHRKSSKDGVDEIPVTSAVAQATAAAAQVAATQASSAAAAATVLQSSIKQIEGKLEKIEKVMLALEKNASPPSSTQLPVAVPPGETASTTAPAPPAPVYQDRDEPVPGDALELIADSDVTIQDRARIEFGKKLAMMIGVKNLTIKSAASLPPSPFTDNAFANSYRYSARDNTLVVHTNRLQSVGDFALILIHALSHIKVNPEDLSNDLDTKFMTEFYRNMKILSLDLYKKTAALSSQGNQQTAAGPGNFASFSLSSSKSKSNLLGSSLRGKKTPSQITTDLPPISDNSGKIDLSALALESPSGANASKSESMTTLTHPQEYFSSESLMERMKMYTQHGNIPADYLEKYAAVYQPQASTALGAAKSTHSDT